MLQQKFYPPEERIKGELDESLKKRIDQEEEILIVDEACPCSFSGQGK